MKKSFILFTKLLFTTIMTTLLLTSCLMKPSNNGDDGGGVGGGESVKSKLSMKYTFELIYNNDTNNIITLEFQEPTNQEEFIIPRTNNGSPLTGIKENGANKTSTMMIATKIASSGYVFTRYNVKGTYEDGSTFISGNSPYELLLNGTYIMNNTKFSTLLDGTHTRMQLTFFFNDDNSGQRIDYVGTPFVLSAE